MTTQIVQKHERYLNDGPVTRADSNLALVTVACYCAVTAPPRVGGGEEKISTSSLGVPHRNAEIPSGVTTTPDSGVVEADA